MHTDHTRADHRRPTLRRGLGLLAVAIAAVAAPVGSSVADELGRRCVHRCDFIERFDFTVRVAPRRQEVAEPADSSWLIPQLNWFEVVRSRIDRPEPPPPLVPAGLAGVAWALEHPAESWRLVLPIPPQQAPDLVLPADPPLVFARLS